MKYKIKSIFLMVSLFLIPFLLNSCKEKNPDYPPVAWSEYSYTGSGNSLREVTAILYENEHSIWLGSGNSEGLLYFDGYTWKVFDISNTGIAFDSITSIKRDGNGNLWVGWRQGLAKYDGSAWQKISSFDGMVVTSIGIEGIGNILVSTNCLSGGLATLQNDKWNFETPENSEIFSSQCNALITDNNQIIWVSTTDAGLLRKKNGVWEKFSALMPLLSQNFTALTLAPDGAIWAGTNDSQLVHFYNNTYTILNTGASKAITSLVAADTNLWISTLGAGLIKFNGKNWTSFTSANAAMPSDTILWITRDLSGDLLFGIPGGKLYIFKI